MADASGGPRRHEGRAVAFVYLAGLLQGVVMVSFAASSAVLRERHGFSDTEYGSIFLPQVALAALGAIGSGAFLGVLDLRHVLGLSLAAMALSQAALAGSHFLDPGPALAAIMLGTALMGLGSGLGAAPLNTYPQVFYPGRSDSAVVAMHTAMGVGLAGGPLFVAGLATHGLWLLFPLAFLAACLALLLTTPRAALPRGARLQERSANGPSPARALRFWLFAAIALLYALTEAGYGNWAVLYLSEEKGLGVAAAGLGLAAFWIALSAGRVLVGFLVLRVPARRVYVALPLLMAGASLLLPGADTEARAVVLFALAGLGCSGFYPLTVSLASRHFPGHMAWVSSMIFAALATGIGAGSFATGALRARLPLSTIYRLEALFPLLALALAVPALAAPPRPRARSNIEGQ